MRYPSIKTILQIPRVTLEQAKRVRGLMDGSIDPETSPAVQRWVRWCYNKPDRNECVMRAIDEELGTCGVEAIRSEKHWRHYYCDIVAVYCNTGDSYCPTVLLSYLHGEAFRIISWGDFVERNRL